MSGSNALGIAVVSYHSKEDLEGFCESLFASDPQLPYSIVIEVVEAEGLEALHAAELADNLSDQALIAGVTQHKANVGYARACNDAADWLGLAGPAPGTGLAYPATMGDVFAYAFFNADTRIRPGVLESCVDLLAKNDGYGIVGPRQVDDHNRLTHAGIFGTLEQPRHRGWHEPAGRRYEDVRDDCVTVSGSAYFVKKKVWDELAACPLYRDADPDSKGAFLVTPHFYEETWCSYHAQAHGYKVAYNGEKTMIHRWHKASPVGGWAEQQFPKSREIFRRACDHHDIPHD